MVEVKAVLFDMDGTLIDSMPALENLAVYVMKAFFDVNTEFARSSYRLTAGIPFGDQLKKIFPYQATERAEAAYLSYKSTPTLEAAVIRSSVLALLEAKKAGKTTGVISSTTQDLVQRVVAREFCGLFNHVGGVMPLKEEQLQIFLSNNNLCPDEVLYYGDTDEDSSLASSVGMGFVRVG